MYPTLYPFVSILLEDCRHTNSKHNDKFLSISQMLILIPLMPMGVLAHHLRRTLPAFFLVEKRGPQKEERREITPLIVAT
jgi:hypothetical protein